MDRQVGALEQLGKGVYVQDLPPELVEAFHAAAADDLGDGCSLCKAAGIRVLDDGRVVEDG